MTFAEAVKLYDLPTTAEKNNAASYLEWRGMKYAVDFGYENVIVVAIREGMMPGEWRAE